MRIQAGILAPLSAVLLLLGACAVPAPRDAGCRACDEAGHAGAVTTLLFFGLSYPGGEVGEAEWQDFLEGTMTPLLPAGFTVIDGSGKWRSPEGKALSERTKVVVAVAAGADDEEAIGRLVAAYKTRFAQQSVLRVRICSAAAF